MKKILHETNLYINQEHRRVPVVTERELYSFSGIKFLMGYHSLPSLTCYWNNDQDVNVPLIANAMSRCKRTTRCKCYVKM